MAVEQHTSFADEIARRLTDERAPIAARWLARLDELLAVDRERIFPSSELLDHVPQLIGEIAAYVRAPEVEELAANTAVVGKARELGLLRHAQQASVHQLLREYHVLGGILEDFLRHETARMTPPPSPDAVVVVAARISYALRVLQQTTIDTFIAEYTDRIAAQRARLENFNSLVSHELRQPLATLQFALHSLAAADPDPGAPRARLIEIATRNVVRMIDLVRQLERIARLQQGDDGDAGRQEVDLSVVAREVARQLQQMAEHRGVRIQVAEDLPAVVTDAARIELVLMNLVSNGIKYSDPAKPERVVEVFLSGATDDGRSICVRDNGIGIPAEDLPHVFESFFRASPDRDAERGITGSGLGLAIVADCVRAIGGRIQVASTEGQGTAFDLWLPPVMPTRVSDL